MLVLNNSLAVEKKAIWNSSTLGWRKVRTLLVLRKPILFCASFIWWNKKLVTKGAIESCVFTFQWSSVRNEKTSSSKKHWLILCQWTDNFEWLSSKRQNLSRKRTYFDICSHEMILLYPKSSKLQLNLSYN